MSMKEIGATLSWLGGLLFALFGLSFIVFNSAAVSWGIFIAAMIAVSLGKFLKSGQIGGE